MFNYRNSVLNEVERELLLQNNIDEIKFIEIFKNLIISEIIQNSIKESRTSRTETFGIIFCGKKIGLEKFEEIKNELAIQNLTLEVSFNEFLYDRFKDFEFPFYSNRDEILRTPKIIYKIYPTNKKCDFIEQVQFPLVDKTSLRNFYNKITEEFGAEVLWADGNENLLYATRGDKEKLGEIMYDFYNLIYPKEYGIENGFYTKESLIQGYMDGMPLIALNFYE